LPSMPPPLSDAAQENGQVSVFSRLWGV
jgi:hypothetical protein